MTAKEAVTIEAEPPTDFQAEVGQALVQAIEQPPAPPNPMAMLQAALERGADPALLDKLMSLQERWEAGQARRAFDAALSAAKAELPVVAKNAVGHNQRRYADFSAYARAIDPVLGKHGLSYRFRTTQTDRINVTCILSHRDGHSEENQLSGPLDTSGAKNPIQSLGSTLSYLMRYSLIQALGLSAAEDDDGKAAGGGETITDEQAATIRKRAEEVGADVEKLCAYLKVDAIPSLPADQFERAIAALEKKRKVVVEK